MPLPRSVDRLLGRPGSVSFRRLRRVVERTAALESELVSLDDTALRARADAARGTQPPRPESALPELLALAREAGRRTLGERAFEPQLLAAAALATGHVVELDTGEGKTLAGVLAAAAQALQGRRVHVLSVNDYLAERDAEWMRGVFALLGIDVGWLGQLTPPDERREVYRRDVVYAPVSEIGFDLLRDRFAEHEADELAPVFDVAIVDEADAVMIDEATHPLVLASAGGGDDTEAITRARELVRELREPEHFAVDDEHSTVTLTDEGLELVEQTLGEVNLYRAEHLPMLTRVNLALHAAVLLQRDRDYLVVHGEIRLVNTGRGRIARLQRWPDGLHAAVEAKEGLSITPPGVLLDTITVQELLAGYATLSGMTGTALGVAEPLLEIYGVDTGRVERRLPNARTDLPDEVLLTRMQACEALLTELGEQHSLGRPVLVGTQSVAESEELGERLRREGLDAVVLNARNDAHEAEIVARAGTFGAITISTQLSGRGTDIRLGGVSGADHDRVAALGGLAVLGLGRYPSSRLDGQLRGRSGRQGDPGSARFFVSLQDELVQAHTTEHVRWSIAARGAELSAAERSRIVKDAQNISEGLRLDQQRATRDYSRAIELQRAVVLERRRTARDGSAGSWLDDASRAHLEGLRRSADADALDDAVRQIAVFHLDEAWQEHLAVLTEIRDGIHLRALANLHPATEFHRIALEEFAGFFDEVRASASATLLRMGLSDIESPLASLGLRRPSASWTYMVRDDPLGSSGDRLVRRAAGVLRRATSR